MSKIEIVNTLVSEGYSLMGETPESFANRWSEDMLIIFLKNFRKWKGEGA